MRLVRGGGMSVLLAVLAFGVPVTPRFPRAWQSPDQAAERAERSLPSLGVLWGRVRGWSRVGTGWTVIWQPSHGAWLVSAWVPDGPGEISWRIDAAPWLPGVRLSREAAEALIGQNSAIDQARERVGRRDWQVGESRVLGALPGGGELPSGALLRRPLLQMLLAGLLLAGAVSRHLVPGVPARGWRQAVGWVTLLLLVTVPELPALAPMTFQPGVRPWVAELAFGAAALLVLGALVFAAQRFPAVASGVPVAWLPLALATGILAGRLEPGTWFVAVAGLSLALPVLVGVTVLGGWLAALAADGLREMLRFSVLVRLAGLLAFSLFGVLNGGPWLGVTLAVVAAAAVERGWGTWIGVAVVWGFVVGSIWAVARWDAALWNAFALLLVGCGAVALAYFVRTRQGASTAGAVAT
jgi:hypothetical protein